MDLVKSGDRRRSNKVASKKYYLEFCNVNVLNNKNTRSWLIIKNILLNSKIVEAIMCESNTRVVVKIGEKNNIDKEYDINFQLKHLKGFVRYICKFSCKDNLDKYISKENPNINGGMCEPNGKDQTNAIIMPYYELKSMINYPWNKENFNLFKKLVKDTIKILLDANAELGFLHNDVHLENIMLKKNNHDEIQVKIIDFELSTINENHKYKENPNKTKLLGMNFKKLFDDLRSKLDFIKLKGIYECSEFTDKMRDPFENTNININDIYRLIDKLEYYKLDS
jgi:serine/threonine protein kinase